MATEDDKIFCNNLAIKCIALEKDLVDYYKTRPYTGGKGDIELKFCSITNELNKIAIILRKISETPGE
tara:strand:+ start:42 stop:245 length:204 start_codon:yes stop_codon:yes gene_type:complete